MKPKELDKITKLHEITNQYIFFVVIHLITSIIVWSYFNILLLRESNNDISLIYFNLFFRYTGVLVGYLIAAKLLPRIGFLNGFRVFSGLAAIFALLPLFVMQNLGMWHIVIGLGLGVADGIFWDLRHILSIKEIHGQERSRLISILYALEVILGIILPISAGAFISAYGYDWVFLLGGFVYIAATVYPWQYNHTSKDHLRWGEMKRIAKRTGFLSWGLLSISDNVLINLRSWVFIVLPFLFIKNEFGVGFWESVLAFFAAVLAVWHRQDGYQKKLKWAYRGGMLTAVSTLFLIFSWNLPALIIRNLFAKSGLALSTPSINEIEYQLRESLIKDYKGEYGLEIQQWGEIFMYIARLISFAFLTILIWGFATSDQLDILRWVMLLTVGRELLFLFWGSKLLSKLQGKPVDLTPRSTSLNHQPKHHT